MPISLIQDIGTIEMAEAFNLNQFLNEYKTYNDRQYTAAENAQAAMEKRDIARAQEAIQDAGFLGITLSKKVSELGIGPRVIEQIGETAKGMAADVVSPLTEWLEKYEKVFDGQIYGDIQSYAKQMFFSKVALDAEVNASVGNKYTALF